MEFHLPSVSSTNDYARELLRTYPYVFVSAMHQTAGRGRSGKVWHGDYGDNVYCSIGRNHTAEPSIPELASFMARGAIAALRVLRKQSAGISFRLKYPNDVQANVDGAWSKIAGVLVEHEFQGNQCTSSVTGVGININQKKFPDTILQNTTSLYLLGYTVDLARFVQDLKLEITALQEELTQTVYQDWIKELDIVGKRVRIVDDPTSWTVVRVLDDGRLMVRGEVTQIERTVSDGDTIRYED